TALKTRLRRAWLGTERGARDMDQNPPPYGIQRFTRWVSDSDRTAVPRRSRVRAGELLIKRWRLPTWWVLILPVLVNLKRFLAPDLVFSLGILLSSGAHRARSLSWVATACPAGRPERGRVLSGVWPEKQAGQGFETSTRRRRWSIRRRGRRPRRGYPAWERRTRSR